MDRVGWLVRCTVVALALTLPVLSGVRVAEIDLALVLAVDVSRSIDDDEFALQRRGYAQAFTNPAVINAIRTNPRHQIAVAFVEWAGSDFQRLVIPWTLISDAESGQLFAESILREPRSFFGWTSISGAIDYSVTVLRSAPHEATRQVIDVSGDGVNNSGRSSDDARDDAVRAGITINGLVIMNDRPTPGFIFQPQPPLDLFYRDHVIGGPGAFLIVIDDFDSFAYAIINKLIREIAGDLAPHDVARAEPLR